MTYQPAVWKGSEKTADAVRSVISERWGQEEAENYDPTENCFTFQTWKAKGYYVRKGEKAIRSITLVEKTDPGNQDNGEQATVRYPKPVYLFYIKQVEKQ